MLFLVILTGREAPSVAGIINPGAEGFHKLFFGQEEIAIPVHSRCLPLSPIRLSKLKVLAQHILLFTEFYLVML